MSKGQGEQKMKQLRVEMKNTKSGREEILYILPMKNENGDVEFMVGEEHYGNPCMKFLVDEGYMHTYYWFDATQWILRNVMVVE